MSISFIVRDNCLVSIFRSLPYLFAMNILSFIYIGTNYGVDSGSEVKDVVESHAILLKKFIV